jgi:hypothetical protein
MRVPFSTGTSSSIAARELSFLTDYDNNSAMSQTIHDACLYCRGNANRTMDAARVVVRQSANRALPSDSPYGRLPNKQAVAETASTQI